MNELKVFSFDDVDVVDSREVAEMTKVRHADLLEKIDGYTKHLANGKFRSLDFFIPSTYKDAQDKPRPHYFLTKKGCDMVANKMTGEKGVLFTAAYVDAFERMRKRSTILLPSDYPSALRALADEVEQNNALRAENEKQKQAIAEFQPIRQYVDTILESTSTLTTTQIAADYDITARRLNQILHEEGIQHNVNGQWILYRKYMGLGYTKSKTIQFTHSDGRPDVKMHTQWTQKGRLKIHEILTARGIFAVMDKRNLPVA